MVKMAFLRDGHTLRSIRTSAGIIEKEQQRLVSSLNRGDIQFRPIRASAPRAGSAAPRFDSSSTDVCA